MLVSLPKAMSHNTTIVCDPWPVRRQTYMYGYLPSRKASPPIGWYQIILLGDRGTCVNTCTGHTPLYGAGIATVQSPGTKEPLQEGRKMVRQTSADGEEGGFLLRKHQQHGSIQVNFKAVGELQLLSSCMQLRMRTSARVK